MPPKKPRKAPTARYRDMQPVRLDMSVTFNSIGGLEDHIKCLREMVIFPLIYPEFFKRFNTHPPKGVLFHGPPGTGKTLLARALATECSLVRGKRVAFFMRKGADVMSKWYGESEKQIKRLFQTAHKMRPSIIFFDEMDALAPTRLEGQCEINASVVATLLVEMDGLYDRGDVIIIGATNRPDCLDPALRRPGRLDRELYFPPPSLLARRDILSIYTRHWTPRPTEDVLHHIATITNGYLGSDLNALCSESVLKALRRVYPQVYDGSSHRFACINSRKIEVTLEDLLAAKLSFLPAGARYIPIASKHLPSQCEPLLGAQLKAAKTKLMLAFPAADLGYFNMMSMSPSVFLISGECADSYLAPALLAALEHCELKELSIATLHSNHAFSQERAIISIFTECRRADRSCVIFVPSIGLVWEALAGTACTTLFLQLWQARAAGDNVLLLATSSADHDDLPDELQDLFPGYKDCVYKMRSPTAAEVIGYLTPVVTLPAPFAGEAGQLVPIEVGMTSTSAELAPRKRRYVDSFVNYHREHKKPRYSGTVSSAALQCLWGVVEGAQKWLALDNSVEDCLCDICATLRPCLCTTNKIVEKKEVSVTILDEENPPIEAIEEKNLCPDVAKLITENAESLCQLGLQALTDLHTQLCKASHVCVTVIDRMRLPQEFHEITSRYLKVVKKN